MSGYSLTIPLSEDFGEIPESAKDGVYYAVITLFVISTLASTLLSAAFLVLSIILWGRFKPIKFFWFLTQLTISVFVLSASNLLINVPATLSLLSKDVSSSAIFNFVTYLIDFCHYSIIFSNLIIAIQRGFVFFLRHLTDKTFDTPMTFAWLSLNWLLSLAVEFILMSSNCKYKFDDDTKVFKLKCQSSAQSSLVVNSATPTGILIVDHIVQILIPILIFVIYLAIIAKILYLKKTSLNDSEVMILKQAIFVFVAFQMEIFAGAATPSFFFFTSKEIRKLVSTKVSAASSQSGSNVQVRGLRTLN
ncbi:hypothetical protein B9Z55_016767 [Caenorhabditis nigoni]|uniref:G-protein coupled receptors family 1 profile domain-containing protein n=1 Tax=Caenorhabditis nigoni TaxID=1611254 RepID=A0A2G5T6P7_9PELO|nr:hypothetical protein B9Z55_016767 [Caenorhabditis nigoni]